MTLIGFLVIKKAVSRSERLLHIASNLPPPVLEYNILIMIEIRGLQKTEGEHTILDIPLLDVAKGDVCLIIGSAGSGIHILFELLTRQLIPSGGAITIAGSDIENKHAFSQNAGILFHQDGLYLRQSVLNNLLISCQIYGLSNNRADSVIKMIGLADQKNMSVEKLPDNLKRRLAFGRTLLHHPSVLILFEPFTRCDEASIDLIRNQIQHQISQGVSVLILTDNPEKADLLATKIYRMNNGKLVEESQDEEPQTITPFKIPIKYNDRVILVNPVDVLFIEAVSGASTLHTQEGKMNSGYSLNELESKLGRSGFFRTHRSYLVNLQHVKEVIPYTRNSFSLRLDDTANTEIPLSKSAAAELRALLGY